MLLQICHVSLIPFNLDLLLSFISTFMTLTLLQITDQLFYKYLSTLVGPGYAPGARISQQEFYVLIAPFLWHIRPIFPITGGMKFDHLSLASFLCSTVTFLTFAIARKFFETMQNPISHLISIL